MYFEIAMKRSGQLQGCVLVIFGFKASCNRIDQNRTELKTDFTEDMNREPIRGEMVQIGLVSARLVWFGSFRFMWFRFVFLSFGSNRT